MHIPDSDKCNWLRARIETAERQEYSQEEKLRILDRRVYSLLFVWKNNECGWGGGEAGACEFDAPARLRLIESREAAAGGGAAHPGPAT